MTNLLEEAINSNDGDHAAKVIQEALGIESDEVANYVFPKTGRTIASSGLGSLVSGCKPRRGFWQNRASTKTLARHVDRSHCDGGGGLGCSCG